MRVGFIEEKAKMQKQIADLEETDFAYLVVAKYNKDDDTQVFEHQGVNTFDWQAAGLLEMALAQVLQDDHEC